jgi:hypothetical protein
MIQAIGAMNAIGAVGDLGNQPRSRQVARQEVVG